MKFLWEVFCNEKIDGESYSTVYSNEKICIVNGSFTSTAGKGTITLTTKLTLHYVLQVPKLACNLLSFSKISKDANCRVVFCESHSTFQNKDLGETIGRAKMIGDLYYFDEVSITHKIAQGLSNVCSYSVKETITFWHRRLGHPNFF